MHSPHDGFEVLSGAICPQRVQAWVDGATRCLALRGCRVDSDAREPAALDEGGPYHYEVADSEAVGELLPDLSAWYESMDTALLLSQWCGREVIPSPYPRSAMTLKRYGPNDEQGWHRDTNPLSVLLCLSHASAGHATEIEGRDGTRYMLSHRPGDLLIFFGRELRHRALPPLGSAPRVTAPLNYYHPDDTWRPMEVDSIVYGTS